MSAWTVQRPWKKQYTIFLPWHAEKKLCWSVWAEIISRHRNQFVAWFNLRNNNFLWLIQIKKKWKKKKKQKQYNSKWLNFFKARLSTHLQQTYQTGWHSNIWTADVYSEAPKTTEPLAMTKMPLTQSSFKLWRPPSVIPLPRTVITEVLHHAATAYVVRPPSCL